MKSLFVLIFLALIALVSTGKTGKTYHWGRRLDNDDILVDKPMPAGSTCLCTEKGEFTYEQGGQHAAIITRVEVIDQSTNGDSGEVKLTEGGPDHTFVKLRSTSKFRRGCNFHVKIYGR